MNNKNSWWIWIEEIIFLKKIDEIWKNLRNFTKKSEFSYQIKIENEKQISQIILPLFFHFSFCDLKHRFVSYCDLYARILNEINLDYNIDSLCTFLWWSTAMYGWVFFNIVFIPGRFFLFLLLFITFCYCLWITRFDRLFCNRFKWSTLLVYRFSNFVAAYKSTLLQKRNCNLK